MTKQATSIYTVSTGPIDHDGARYPEGGEIPLSSDAAAPLLALGAIEAAPPAAKPKAAEKAPD
jgi:hypothetical protein